MTGCQCGQLGDDCERERCPHFPRNTAVAVPADTLARLRTMRRWHWVQVSKNRRLADRAPSGEWSRRYHIEADTHLSFVQSLNEFFPAGDYES